MLRETKKNSGLKWLIIIAALVIVAGIDLANAQTGASVTNISTSQKSASSPQWNNGTKGAIHTVNLNAEQQNTKWKAYVGNVSSTFVLDDANDYSIYQWTVDSFSGQVYVARNSVITWGSVGCASAANKATEDTALSHLSTAADSVNRTFSSQIHNNLTVGSTFIGNNTCYSTVTWQNDANHQLNSTAPFQELLLWDGDDMIYTVFVENDKTGYRPGTTYDFQAIVPESGIGSNPALTYYFYLELS